MACSTVSPASIRYRSPMSAPGTKRVNTTAWRSGDWSPAPLTVFATAELPVATAAVSATASPNTRYRGRSAIRWTSVLRWSVVVYIATSFRGRIEARPVLAAETSGRAPERRTARSGRAPLHRSGRVRG